MGALFQLSGILFGALHVVQEVGTVLALGIDGDLVVPPGLMGLNVGLYAHGGVYRGGHVFGVAHGLGLGQDGFHGSLVRGGLGGGGSLGGSRGLVLLAAASKGGQQGEGQQQGNDLFHFESP